MVDKWLTKEKTTLFYECGFQGFYPQSLLVFAEGEGLKPLNFTISQYT